MKSAPRRAPQSGARKTPVARPGLDRHAPPGESALPFGSISDAAVRAASEAIVTIDEQQHVVMINPAALRMFGCTAAEALGAPLSNFLPPRSRRVHKRLVREFDTSGACERAMGTRGTVHGRRASGELFPIEAAISRVEVRGEHAQRRYFTALLRDLTREQSLQQQIDTLNRRMRAVFDLAPVAIWITDSDRIVFANNACAQLFGAATREQLLGRTMYELLAPESHATVRRTIARMLRRDEPVPPLTERIARLDGGEREVVIALAPLPDHARTAVQMAITDVTERARESRELERSRRELRQLSASLVNAREDERRRIARELHDELGQRLTALKMELASLDTPAADGSHDRRVGAMLDMVDDTVASVRRIATELRPLMLDDLGLNAAIEWLANGWANRMGIAVKLQLGRSDPALGEGAAIAVYRMVQEALTNIARHARATEVRITLRQKPGMLTLTVQDNGVGFDAASPVFREGSHGLMGIRERAYMLGGDFDAGNAARGGARITVQLPTAVAGPMEDAPR